jgi:hypothetical protein
LKRAAAANKFQALDDEDSDDDAAGADAGEAAADEAVRLSRSSTQDQKAPASSFERRAAATSKPPAATSKPPTATSKRPTAKSEPPAATSRRSDPPPGSVQPRDDGPLCHGLFLIGPEYPADLDDDDGRSLESVATVH